MLDISPRVTDLLRRIERHVIETPDDDEATAAQDAEWSTFSDEEKDQFRDHASIDGVIITMAELLDRWDNE